MKLPVCLSFTYVGLLLLTMDNCAYNIPISADSSLYGSDSAENVEMNLSDCIEREDCLKIDIIDEIKVDDIITDFGTKNNYTHKVSSDKNTMSNEVPILIQSTDKNQTHNITFYKTSTKADTDYEFNKVLESEMNEFVSSDTSSNDIDKLISEEPNDNVGFTIVDDILYEDMPAILIIYIVNDDGEVHNIEVENAVQVTDDEITLNLIKAVQALADFINKEDMSLEDSMERTVDSEPEEPERIAENGYIFYDMGESNYFSDLHIFHLLRELQQGKKISFLNFSVLTRIHAPTHIYSIYYGNDGASSAVSDVDRYVIIRKLQHSIFDIITHDIPSVKLPEQGMPMLHSLYTGRVVT
jgi:hypothetical protein